MLVLTRRINEKIIINDNITVGILKIEGQKVYLGISAPKNIPIHRQEIYERIKRNKKNSINDLFISDQVTS